MKTRYNSQSPRMSVLHYADIEQLPKWIALEAIGGFYEICMAAFALLLMWELQMPTSSKVSVVAGFAMRLPSVSPAHALRPTF